MPEQKITLTIDDDGAISAKTSGFKGESCLEALDELLNLNGVVSSVKRPMSIISSRPNKRIGLSLSGKS